jgi:hypothetical protein
VAWGLSTGIHLVLLSVALAVASSTHRGSVDELERPVGVVLVKNVEGQRQYYDESGRIATPTAAPNATAPNVSFLPSEEELAIDLSQVLPGENRAGRKDQRGLLPRAGAHAGGGLGRAGITGTTTTQVFGVPGTGSRFVYVFDRSGSMDGRPLRAAQAQLHRSLNDLDRVNQFQIIFYNHQPRVFNPAGAEPRLMWADDATKRMAQEFVSQISADGGTDHLRALRIALAMRPDVVFFLTDADEPKLTAVELLEISRLNGGTTIHAIEFGRGPQADQDNFLARLAGQNSGQHIYVDISSL